MSLGSYENTGNELRDRILALIPEHPEIIEMDSPWDLFKVPGFNCKDLEPTMFQAGWALSAAKRKYKDDSHEEQKG